MPIAASSTSGTSGTARRTLAACTSFAGRVRTPLCSWSTCAMTRPLARKYHGLRPSRTAVFLRGPSSARRPRCRSVVEALVFAAAPAPGQAAPRSARRRRRPRPPAPPSPLPRRRRGGGGGHGARRGFPLIAHARRWRRPFPASAALLGFEQPAFVVERWRPTRELLVTTKPLESSCEAHHGDTRRLCPALRRSQLEADLSGKGLIKFICLLGQVGTLGSWARGGRDGRRETRSWAYAGPHMQSTTTNPAPRK